MATTVKGITVEFAGDTTQLDKALRKVRESAKSVDQELKAINSALKFNPNNVQLLAQKQTVLKQKIADTTKSLKDLKDMQTQLDKQGVSKSSEEYRRLQREIITTESKLKHFKRELQKVNAQRTKIYQLGEAFDAAGKKIEGAGRSLAGLSRAAGAVTGALAGVTYKAAEMADDLNTLSKQTGISTHDLQMYAATADLVDVSVETMAKSQTKLKRSMLTASQGGTSAKYFEQLGIAVTDANGELRDSNDVFQDTIVALGKMENETERDAIAMAIFGKSANELNPLIEDGGRTYEKVAKMMQQYGLEPVDQEGLDRANEFKDQLDTIKLLFTQVVQIVGTKIAGYLVPMMQKVVDKAAQISQYLASLSGELLAKIMSVSGAVAALSPALIVIGKIAQAFGRMLKNVMLIVSRIPLIGRALTFLGANPVVMLVAGFVALAVAIQKAGLSAEDITKKITEFSNNLAAKLPGIIDKVVEILTNLVQVIAEQAPVIMQAAIDLFMGLVDALPVIAPVLLDGIVQLIGAIVKALPGMAVQLINASVQIARSLWAAVQQVFANVAGWFGQKFGAAWQAVKNKFAGWASFWGNLWTNIKNKFTNIGTSIANAISGAIRSGINGAISRMESIINSGINLINGAINLINKLPGVSVGHIGNISLPRLAKGGVLYGAQTVIAGEAGPEAIVPLDKLFAQMDKMAQTIAGAGEGITINVYGAEGQSVRSLAEEVSRVLIQEQKRRTLAWQ